MKSPDIPNLIKSPKLPNVTNSPDLPNAKLSHDRYDNTDTGCMMPSDVRRSSRVSRAPKRYGWD